jgi:hypothetical protein
MKSYVYKWYSDDEYVGVLDNVISEYSIREEINSAGTQLQVKLGKSLDASNAELLTDLLVDENGDSIVTNNLESIITGQQADIDGLPGLNDKIEVWEYGDEITNLNASTLLGIRDTFTGNEINQLIWETYGDVEALDSLVMNLDGAVPSYNGVYTKQQHNLENKYIVVEAVDTITTWTSMEMSMQILQGSNADNKIYMLFNNDILSCNKTIGGVDTQLTSTTYDADEMRWWKISNLNGNTNFEYSNNGTTWVLFYTMADVIDFSSNEIHLQAGNYSVETGTAYHVFDNFCVLGETNTLTTVGGGTLVYNGLVSAWESDYDENNITINLLSYGVELSNYLVQVGAGDIVAENETWDSTITIYPAIKSGNNIWLVAQTLDFSVDTTIRKIVVGVFSNFEITRSYKLTLVLAEGEPSDWSAPLGSVTINTTITPEENWLEFTFASTIAIDASKNYYFYIANYTGDSTYELDLLVDTGALYADGEVYTHNKVDFTLQSYDLAFYIESGDTTLGNQFNSADPSQIVETLLDTYNSLGGTITAGEIATTNTVVSYTFKFNTYLEAINKCLELAPANWWWRVDVATNYLYFLPRDGVAEHTFIKGKHIQGLQIRYTLEQMKNTGYFIGGETAGVNLVTSYNAQSSINQYGSWLETITDNRVTLQDTADLLIQNAIGQSKDPVFAATVKINSSTYNTNNVKVGQVISLRNYNTVIESILFQIMAKATTPDYIELTLTLLSPTVSKRVEDIKRNLLLKETENNSED